jgi:tetratricopeptide (TPR) repeat protein
MTRPVPRPLTRRWAAYSSLWLPTGGYSEKPYPLELLWRKAELLRLFGKRDRAAQLYEQNLARLESSPNVSLLAKARFDLGSVQKDLGKHAEALANFHQAMDLYRSQGDDRGQCQSYVAIGMVRSLQSEYINAGESFQQAQEFAQGIGDQKLQCQVLSGLGYMYIQKEDWVRAGDHLRQQLAFCRELDDRQGICLALNNLGIVSTNVGDYPAALSYYQEALKLAEQIGDKQTINYAIGNSGNVHNILGDYRAALECFARDLALAEETGNRFSAGIAHYNLALVQQALGDMAPVERHFDRAIAIARDLSMKYYLCLILNGRAEFCLKTARPELALKLNDEALRTAREIDDISMPPVVILVRAKLLTASRPNEARALLSELLSGATDADIVSQANHGLYLLTGERTNLERARAAYRAVYEKTPSKLTKDKMEKLERKEPY